MYRVTQGFSEDVTALYAWAFREFQALEQSFFDLDMIQLKETHVAPVRPRVGMTLLADGTDWDPGAGQGVYTYYNGAWRRLG